MIAAVPPLTTTIFTTLGSGLVVALLNVGYSVFKDYRQTRKQKLEELHRAIFRITFKNNFIIVTIEDELNRRKTVLGQPETKASTRELEEIEKMILQLEERIPTDEILDSMETAACLITVYFRALRPERNALNKLAHDVAYLSKFTNPDDKIAGEGMEAYVTRIKKESVDLGQRLFHRIWEISSPRFLRWLRRKADA